MKKHLIVNPGSASRKYALYENGKELLSGHFERGASGGGFAASFKGKGWEIGKKISAGDYKKSMSVFLDFLLEKKLIACRGDIGAIGFRVVAPGDYFLRVQVIGAGYVKKLEEARGAAPLHIGPALSEIKKTAKLFPKTKKFGISDSAFHSTMPEAASTYGIPSAAARKLGIRRFGYHGISVESVSRKAKKIFKKTPARIIVCHLGSGASLTALKGGKSVDTSMGFTPLEGLLMGTRPGDIGAGALIRLAGKKKLTYGELDEYLNKKCGLLGVSGKTSDVRELLALEKKDPRAALALDVFAYRAKKYIGGYTAALGGLDLLVFTAAIGERSDVMRERICRGLEPLGIVLDEKKNKETTRSEGFIHARKSKVKIAVLKTDESGEIALKMKETKLA